MKNNFILFFAMLVFAIEISTAQQVITLNSADAKKMLDAKTKVVLLDVRPATEVAQGHLANSINIDIYRYDAYLKIDKLDKKATYLVYCRSKNSSSMAVVYMSEHGFKHIYHLTDGFVGWSESNFPIVK